MQLAEGTYIDLGLLAFDGHFDAGQTVKEFTGGVFKGELSGEVDVRLFGCEDA